MSKNLVTDALKENPSAMFRKRGGGVVAFGGRGTGKSGAMRYRFSDGMFRSADGKRFPKRKSLDDLIEVVFVAPPKPKRRVLVWECRIEVPGDSDLPSGADAIPRQAALDALELAGVQILGCESGWQPFLTKTGDPSTFGGRAYAEGKE